MTIKIKFLRMEHIIRALNDDDTFIDTDHKTINAAKRASRLLQKVNGQCLRVVDKFPTIVLEFKGEKHVLKD